MEFVVEVGVGGGCEEIVHAYGNDDYMAAFPFDEEGWVRLHLLVSVLFEVCMQVGAVDVGCRWCAVYVSF